MLLTVTGSSTILCKNGYANTAQRYLTLTMPVLFPQIMTSFGILVSELVYNNRTKLSVGLTTYLVRSMKCVLHTERYAR